MNTQLSDRWWEVAVIALAVSSVILGVVAVGNGHVEWAVATGFAPAVLLVGGLGLRIYWRTGATVAVIIASIAAAAWWWMIYPVFLAAVVIIGGAGSGKIGSTRPGAHPAQ